MNDIDSYLDTIKNIYGNEVPKFAIDTALEMFNLDTTRKIPKLPENSKYVVYGIVKDVSHFYSIIMIKEKRKLKCQ